MKRIKKLLSIITVVSLFFGSFLNANDPQVVMEIVNLTQDPQGYFIAYKGTPFQIKVNVINGNRDTGLTEIKGLKELRIIGSSQSSSFSLNNGSYSSNTTYTYEVQPDHTGTVTIGPAIIKKNDRSIESNVIHIKITNDAPPAKPTPQEGSFQQEHKPEEASLFCELNVSKKQVFVGEPFDLSLNIYSNGNILQTGIEQPKFPGFWIKEIGQVHGASVKRNGIDYGLIQKKYILIAKQPGEKKIEPIKVAYAAQVQQAKQKRSGSFADDFFADFFGGSRVKEFSTSSNPISLLVKEIPRHQGTVDGIGTFKSYTAQLEKLEVTVNDPVVLKVELSGKGNFDQIADPKLILPSGIKFYKSKTNVIEDLTNEYTGSTKIFEFILQPSITGNITITPQKFTYFDTELKIYRTLITEPLILTIKQRETPQPTLNTPASAHHNEPSGPKDLPIEKNHEISFIEEEGNPIKQSIFEVPWYIFILLLFIPLFLVGDMSGGKLKSLIPAKLLSNHTNKKMTQKFKQDFDSLLQKKDIQQLYHFFVSLIAFKNNIEATEVTEQWMSENLPQKGWEISKATNLIDFLNECASLHFVATHNKEQSVLLEKAAHWMLILSQ